MPPLRRKAESTPGSIRRPMRDARRSSSTSSRRRPQTLTVFEDSALVVRGDPAVVETRVEGPITPIEAKSAPIEGQPRERRWTIHGDGQGDDPAPRKDGRRGRLCGDAGRRLRRSS